MRGKPTAFDRFASAVSAYVSKAWFFALCVTMVVVWAPSILVMPSVDSWQLVINTATTIITFLLVALLQNTQYRADDALQCKLNAIAEGVAVLIAVIAEEAEPEDIERVLDELAAVVGQENHERT